MIDKNRSLTAFKTYTSNYDLQNSMIRHKVEHTARVAENCERIAGSLDLDSDSISFAWFMGLLHDIGRFEQVKRYETFIDSVSVDHAEFGADLLFKDNLIKEFSPEGLSDNWMEMLEKAIRLHNKLNLPDELDERTRLFCNIIRDADKIDIFRVVVEMPFEERIGSSKGMLKEGDEASGVVMECVYKHRCVPRDIRKSRFDGHISHCCMAFELVFEESRKITIEQGFLLRLLTEEGEKGQECWNEKEISQLRILRDEIEAAWEQTL